MSNKKVYCLDCPKLLSQHAYYYGYKRCQSCSCKERYKDPKKVPFYKHGLTIIKHYCLDCPKEIDYRSKRCKDCELKNPERYKKIYSTNSKAPTIPEKKIEYIINNFIRKYEYVGDGKFWIERFNPDFIDFNNKNIIEVYGNYWHNLDGAKRRDKKRLEIYKKHGYRTLIIWEKEINNSFRYLIYKIRKFTNEQNNMD